MLGIFPYIHGVKKIHILSQDQKTFEQKIVFSAFDPFFPAVCGPSAGVHGSNFPQAGKTGLTIK